MSHLLYEEKKVLPKESINKVISNFELMEFTSMEELYPGEFVNMDAKVIRDTIRNRDVLILRKVLLAEVLKPIGKDSYTMLVEVPSSWWQLFKKTYFNEWLIKKFPIKTKKIEKTLEVRILNMYPYCNIAFDWAKQYNTPRLTFVDKEVSKSEDLGKCVIEFNESFRIK